MLTYLFILKKILSVLFDFAISFFRKHLHSILTFSPKNLCEFLTTPPNINLWSLACIGYTLADIDLCIDENHEKL